MAVPVPNRTGWVGSPAGASHRVNTGGSGWLLVSMPGLVNASFPPIAAGPSVIAAVSVLPAAMLELLIVTRPPTPLLLGLLPPLHWPLEPQLLKPYLLMVKLAVLAVMASFINTLAGARAALMV